MKKAEPDEYGRPVCPDCGNFVPNNATPGEYPGALSRRGDYEVCSECGVREAMEDFAKMMNK